MKISDLLIYLPAALGITAIVTVCAVWWRKQVFSIGGFTLAMLGAVLIGLSIGAWQSVEFKIGTEGVMIRGIVKNEDGKITVDGVPTPIVSGLTQIGFWTPSIRTKETYDAKRWLVLENEERLDKFADDLMAAKLIDGYRRYDVTGAGEGSRKMGMWWVATNKDGFRIKDFVVAYNKFWQPGEDTTYMEILSLRARGYPTSSGK